MTQAPPLTGQHIGEASGAVTALLEHQLATSASGVTATDFVILRVIAVRGPWTRDALHAFLASQRQLDLDDPGIAAHLEGLRASGVITRGDDVELTTEGKALFGELTEQVAATSRQLYAGFAPEDLATTRKVLARVTDRANELRKA